MIILAQNTSWRHWSIEGLKAPKPTHTQEAIITLNNDYYYSFVFHVKIVENLGLQLNASMRSSDRHFNKQK